ncbi:MAG: cobyrinate a,c-diamide synthase [Clostridia bacterium]|nr:cobyrinate a,c-diamide synthase [Clostridia bacterium]
MFAGTSSDVGKTTIVLGIMRALTKKNLKVQGYKAGPDYIDTAFHSFATHIPSRNLDPWMLTQDTIQGLIGKNEKQCDISIMEGVMGMYDGASIDSIQGSSAHLAKITETPVILIINGSGVALSAAAMVLGFKNFDPEINLAGVIVNKVGSEKHYQLIKDAIEKHVKVPCVGYLKKSEEISLKSRHLGLIPSVEVKALDEKIDQVAEMVLETVDLDLLMTLGKQAKKFNVNEAAAQEKVVKLAVAYDNAFNFYYEDNLDLLESLGCELVRFSPINDTELPRGIDGLYLGGGFPEVFAKELYENKSMRTSIRHAIEKDLPTYAECGGLMYLTQEITTLENETYEMCGVFEAASTMTKSLQRFGYVDVTLNRDSILGEKGTTFKGHEFHRSMVIEPKEHFEKGYDITKGGYGEGCWQCGYIKNACLAGYPHIHFYNNKHLAENFVEAMKRYRSKK